MGKLLDTITTISDGTATCTFTGTGIGKRYFYTKIGTIQSEIHEIIDALYYDNCTTNKTTNYTKTRCSLALTDGELTATKTASGDGYIELDLSGNSLSGYLGKTIHFETDIIEADTNVRLRIYQYVGGDSPANVYSNSTTSGKLTLTDEIDASATRLRLRLDLRDLSVDETCTFKDILIYSEAYLAEYNLSISATETTIETGDTTTLTVSLTENGTALSGETVNLYQDGTLIDTLTTDEDGEATYTYTGTGAGDVSFQAEYGILLSETYTIEDCLISLLPETTITNDEGTKISSIGLDTIPNIQNTDFILSFEHKGNGTLSIGSKNNWDSSSANYRLTLGYADAKHYYSVRTSSTSEGYGASASTSTNYEYRIEREGSSIRFYQGETLITTKTATFLTSYDTWSIYSLIWGSATSVFKNIKLKPL